MFYMCFAIYKWDIPGETDFNLDNTSQEGRIIQNIIFPILPIDMLVQGKLHIGKF